MSDDFERASLGSSWTRYGLSDATIVGDSALGVLNTGWCFVGWTGTTFELDQFSEAEISQDIDREMLVQVYVRRRSSDQARYAFHWNGDPGKGLWEIKYDGVPTFLVKVLASLEGPGPLPGDFLRIEVTGRNPVVIRGYHEDVLVLTATDSALSRITGAGVAGVVARKKKEAQFPRVGPIVESWQGGTVTIPEPEAHQLFAVAMAAIAGLAARRRKAG